MGVHFNGGHGHMRNKPNPLDNGFHIDIRTNMNVNIGNQVKQSQGNFWSCFLGAFSGGLLGMTQNLGEMFLFSKIMGGGNSIFGGGCGTGGISGSIFGGGYGGGSRGSIGNNSIFGSTYFNTPYNIDMSGVIPTNIPTSTTTTGKTDDSSSSGKTDDSSSSGKTDDSSSSGRTDGSSGSGRTDGSSGSGRTDDSSSSGTTDGSSGSGRTGGSSGSGRTGGSSGSGVSGAQDTPSWNTEWSAEQKAKPIRFQMTVAFSTSSGAMTATVVTPGGHTYIEHISMSQYQYGKFFENEDLTIDSKNSMNMAGNRLLERLKHDGWTNATLENSNFKWAYDGKANSGVTATGNVAKPDAPAEDLKKQHHDLYIYFSVHVVVKDGSATVTTPDGKLHQVSTGASLTQARARQALVDKMRTELKNDGWKDITLKNDNFNDWS